MMHFTRGSKVEVLQLLLCAALIKGGKCVSLWAAQMSPPSLISAEEEAENSTASTSATEKDCEVLQEKPKNIILDLISQFKNNLDLHKVTLPVFVLEPRSMLERITDFMSHQQLLFGLSQVQSAEERFLGVVRYFLSGWHVSPFGVRKQFNSVLGEHFRCKWSAFEDESTSFYFSEQVSHHPPISAFTLLNQKNCIFISGTVNLKSKVPWKLNFNRNAW